MNGMPNLFRIPKQKKKCKKKWRRCQKSHLFEEMKHSHGLAFRGLAALRQPWNPQKSALAAELTSQDEREINERLITAAFRKVSAALCEMTFIDTETPLAWAGDPSHGENSWTAIQNCLCCWWVEFQRLYFWSHPRLLAVVVGITMNIHLTMEAGTIKATTTTTAMTEVGTIVVTPATVDAAKAPAEWSSGPWLAVFWAGQLWAVGATALRAQSSAQALEHWLVGPLIDQVAAAANHNSEEGKTVPPADVGLRYWSS
jgi:hypothetical protein